MTAEEKQLSNQTFGKGKTNFQTFNPIKNAANSTNFEEATETEIKKATLLAWKAFKIFRKTSDNERAIFLETIADEIENLGQKLTDTFTQETGLPQGRAEGERGRTVFQLRSFATMLRNKNWRETTVDESIPDRQPLPKPDLRKTMIPLGPVVVFGASNFPLAYSTAGGDTASALAAGCPVIVKSHPMHAGVGELIASAIAKAAKTCQMPDGVFSNLNSSGIEVGIQLVQDPKIKAIGFTGSITAGRALFDLANQRVEPIPVFAEMGSVNPVILFPNALENDAEQWAKTFAGSITVGIGQFCTKPGLLFGIKSEGLTLFCDSLAKEIEETTPMVMLHPTIKKKYTEAKNEIVSQDGVLLLTKELQVKENYADQAVARVRGDQFLSNPKLHQEVFGPFSMVVECASNAELLSCIEGLEGQLTGTIIANEVDAPHLVDVIDELQQRVGRIIYNGVPTGVEVCPSMNHGGPYPASTDARFTAVGTDAIKRWLRPISFQDFPKEFLPTELKNE